MKTSLSVIPIDNKPIITTHGMREIGLTILNFPRLLVIKTTEVHIFV